MGKGMKLEDKVLANGIMAYLRAFAAVSAVFAFSLCAAFSAAAAAAPEWSAGFPKSVEKNVLLQWSPVKGASQYKVYRTETRDKDLKLAATVKPNRHIDKDVPGGKTFFYYVAAVVDGKEGPRSKAGVVQTPVAKVFVPLTKPELAGAHIKTKPDGTLFVGLRWEGGAGTELIGYNVYRSTSKGKGYTLIGSSDGSQYEDEDIKRDKTYYYTVTSVDSNFKETKRSNEVKVEIPKLEVAEPVEVVKKEEVKPTKMRASKLLYMIPAEGMSRKEMEEKDIPIPENAVDVAVDEAVGHIYVASYQQGGVLVYDMAGKFQYFLRPDGANGKERFSAPQNVAVGPNGNVYVTDYVSPDLYIYDYKGKLLDKLNVDVSHIAGLEKGHASLYGVNVTADGAIYVSDPTSSRVYGYDYKKKRVMEIAPDKKDKKKLFSGPGFMTLINDNTLAFVDAAFSKIFVYGTDGKFIRTIGQKGMGVGFLYFPTGVATGKDGELFSVSGLSPNIQAFDPATGEFMYLLCDENCENPPPVKDMRGICVDSQNRVYIADGLSDRVVVLQLLDKYTEFIPEK